MDHEDLDPEQDIIPQDKKQAKDYSVLMMY